MVRGSQKHSLYHCFIFHFLGCQGSIWLPYITPWITSKLDAQLTYIEYKTPALYHACANVLGDVDNVQRKSLSDLGVSEFDALVHFRLAPLRTRRDIATMGVIHRSALRKGPEQIMRLFPPATAIGRRLARRTVHHSMVREILIERTQTCVIDRSALGWRIGWGKESPDWLSCACAWA